MLKMMRAISTKIIEKLSCAIWKESSPSVHFANNKSSRMHKYMSSTPFIIVSLGAIQMIIAAIITRKNKDIFDKYPSHQYVKAWVQLKKRDSSAANILLLMYALMPVEYLIAVLLHKIGY